MPASSLSARSATTCPAAGHHRSPPQSPISSLDWTAAQHQPDPATSRLPNTRERHHFRERPANKVLTCAVCRTDLHVSEGDLPVHREHVTPGHMVVGRVMALGEGVTDWAVGDRVGVASSLRVASQCDPSLSCPGPAEPDLTVQGFWGYSAGRGPGAVGWSWRGELHDHLDVIGCPLHCLLGPGPGGAGGSPAAPASPVRGREHLGGAVVVPPVGVHRAERPRCSSARRRSPARPREPSGAVGDRPR